MFSAFVLHWAVYFCGVGPLLFWAEQFHVVLLISLNIWHLPISLNFFQLFQFLQSCYTYIFRTSSVSCAMHLMRHGSAAGLRVWFICVAGDLKQCRNEIVKRWLQMFWFDVFCSCFTLFRMCAAREHKRCHPDTSRHGWLHVPPVHRRSVLQGTSHCKAFRNQRMASINFSRLTNHTESNAFLGPLLTCLDLIHTTKNEHGSLKFSSELKAASIHLTRMTHD